MLYPCKEIYVKRVGVPLAESYRPEIIDRVSEDFLRLKPLLICCFGRPRMRAWQSWMHSGSEGE